MRTYDDMYRYFDNPSDLALWDIMRSIRFDGEATIGQFTQENAADVIRMGLGRGLLFEQDTFIGLTEEGRRWLDTVERNAKAGKVSDRVSEPKKRGRPTNIAYARKVATEYERGLEEGEWEGQADYLRRVHNKRWEESQNAAKSWLSTLLKRVRDNPD